MMCNVSMCFQTEHEQIVVNDALLYRTVFSVLIKVCFAESRADDELAVLPSWSENS